MYRALLLLIPALALLAAPPASPLRTTAAVAGELDLGDHPTRTQYYGGRDYGGRGSNLCANWHNECSRLWGYGTPNWNACMSQPAAQWDCGGGGRRSRWQGYGYEGPRPDLCANWRRECARLYGWQTRNWYSCMNQPGAIRHCGGGNY
jgi:hypothetical protein